MLDPSDGLAALPTLAVDIYYRTTLAGRVW